MSMTSLYSYRRRPATGDIVAANVRAEASRRGYTQVQLGRALGISQQKATRRWRNLQSWSFDELDMIADLFGLTVADLVTDQMADIKQNPDRWIAPSGAAARSKGLEPPTF